MDPKSYLVQEPALNMSPAGSQNELSITIRNSGNTACTLSASELWSQYPNAGNLQVTLSLKPPSTWAVKVNPGSELTVGLSALIKSARTAPLISAVAGGIKLRCVEDESGSVVLAIAFGNTLVPAGDTSNP
jgi:hypothetical protein